MQNVLQTGKRAVSVAVAAATMLFSVGAGLLQPAVAAAASAGDLIKGTSLTTVYYYGYDGMRYTFPNEKTYMTWYSDFSDVNTISDSALADLSLAGNVVYRPGSYWIKVQSDDKVYAVSTDGSIHWIESEDVAVDYAGSNWNTRIQDVPDVFFGDYTVGSSLMTATAFDGMLYMDGGSYYISWGGEKRMVSSAGRSANGLQASMFLSGTGIDDSSLTAGDDITSGVSSIMDAAQTVTDEPSSSGDVSISLASSTAASATIPDAASSVSVATFKVTAGDAASIDVMNVALMGLAATTNFASSGVYLYEGSDRLTDGKSFNSSTRQATFGSLGLDFAAGETRYITVVVDMANLGTTTTFSVGLEGSADVEASGNVSGSFPISGNTMSIVNSDVGAVTVIDTGSLTNPVVGEQDAIISKFKITETSSDEDVSFERITLKIGGTSSSEDHSDYQLYQGSTWLAAGSNIGNDLVVFDLGSAAYSIDKGSDKTFTVTADIGGTSGETITTHLDNDADLYVVGLDFGFGVTVTATDFDTSAEGSTVTIQGGELSVAFGGPTASDVSNTTENFSLFEGTMTAELAMTITAMPMALAMVNDDATGLETDPISDIRIVNADTGALLMGPLDLASTDADDTAETLSFTDDFDMAAGEVLNFKVTADMESTAEAADTFTLTMNSASGLTAEDMDGDAITDIVPNTDLAGNAQTVVVSGLTVSLASTPTGTKTYVRGSTDVTFVSFNFAAANGGAIEVTEFSPQVLVDEDSGGTYVAGTEGTTLVTDRITSCSLYNGSTLISGPESIESATAVTGGKINFTDFSFVIDAGITETLSVHCNLANVNPGTADLFAIASAATSDVTALDSEGDSATVTGTANTTPSMAISVTNAGTLAVTAASDTPSSDFVLTGSSANSVSKFRFDATGEAFTVNRLTVQESQAALDGAAVGAYANNISLVTVSYPDSTGATQTATGALTSNGVTLNDLTFYVGKDDNAEVTIKIDVPSTDRSSGSATSNERMTLVLDDGTGEARAVGVSSGVTLSATNDITGISAGDTAGLAMAKFVVRETKPTIALSSSSPSGAKVVGNQEVLRFNVTAAGAGENGAGEDVVLHNIIFTMSATDNAGTDWNQCGDDTTAADFHIYNMNKLGTATALDTATTDWVMLGSNGTTCSTADVAFVKLVLPTAEVIPAGSTYAYALYFNSTGASSVNDDSIQFGLASDPIVSVGQALGTTRNTVAGLVTATSMVGAAALDTTASSAIAVGDVVYETGSSERILVVAYTPGASSFTGLRGYMGTTPAAWAGSTPMLRMPGALLWQDDGSTAVSAAGQEYYGAHLVDSLPISGNALSF